MLKQNLLLVYKGKSRLSKLCYVTLVSVLIEESRGPKYNRLVLSKALHPSSFHCCQPQDPSHVFVLPSLLALRARLGARPLVFVCPRKLLKERATFQGVTRPACELSLSYLSHNERQILADMGYPQPPTPIYCDNEVAIGLASDSITLKMSKSLGMRFHWLRDRA
jgi:hypothetical protein